MHRKLKRKFALVCTVLTGVVLLAACLFAYSYSKAQVQSKYEESFAYQSQTLSIFLAGTRQMQYSQLYQMEQEGEMLIYFYDNGIPLYAADSFPQVRDGIYDAFVAALGQQAPELTVGARSGGSAVNHSIAFSYGDEPYLGKYVSTPTGGQQWYSFFLARSISEQRGEIRQLFFLYLFVFFFGLVLLFFISWLLAVQTVKPVESAHRQQGEFIAAASHELKSPLAVITACADYARQEPEQVGQSLENILAESRRMSLLVDDLLLLSGAETGRWRVVKAPVNLENIALDVYENYRPLARSKGQELKLTLPEEDLPLIQGDEDRIVQLLSILVSNALAYSPSGAEVEIAAQIQRKRLIVRVIDHGIGISDQEKLRVFDRFYRSDKSRSEKNHFGLGLSVAKELADLHDAALSILDTPGGGATFEVAFRSSH